MYKIFKNNLKSIHSLNKRLVLLNRYYKITKFYSFLKNTAFKGSVAIIVFIIFLVGLEVFVLDFNSLLNHLVSSYSATFIFSFFLTSETILGIIPPEVFIAWASKSTNPWLYLLILATISYVGGIISYLIGGRVFLIPSIKSHIENKIVKHIVNLRKWGGLFVLLGAISPIPHSLVSLASGLIKYNFKYYLMWSLFRYARFVIYALVIFKVFI
ncbi:short-chain dehydrogenase [Flavobacteriaceae bacterium]|nr:short-chain dehydrogenase [Flavobacteriaceae bacterium]